MGAFLYGLLVALAFLGILFVLLCVVSAVYKPSKSSKCIVVITEEMNKKEICNLLYGIYFKSIFNGDCVYENIIIVDMLTDVSKKVYLNELSEHTGNFNVVAWDTIQNY